ncbi:MAG: glycosyl hydrolase family 65 protein [Novosphingobium sp.]|uniref:glycoside hydrolase family 65 protein n=1 Tax=Novosphingobium sp. TaxID=1874826 RepID=UPI0032B80709
MVKLARELPDADFNSLPFGSDPWRLCAGEADLALGRIPALMTLGNGFIGLCGPSAGSTDAGVYLNGVHARMPIHYHEGAYGYALEGDVRIPACNPSMFRIEVNGQTAAGWSSAELDMASGQLRLTCRTSEVAITVQRIVMMTSNLIVTRIGLIAEADAVVRVTPVITNPAKGSAKGPELSSSDGVYDPRVGNGGIIPGWTEVAVSPNTRVDCLLSSGWTTAAVIADCEPKEVRLAQGVHETIDLFAAIEATSAASYQEALDSALELVGTAREKGFETLAQEQRDWWRVFWGNASLSIPNLPAAEQAVRHGLFQLIQAAGRDGRTSLAAKGQTGEGYEGHVFWDADVYALPVLAQMAPATARAMLTWRISCLDDARANARSMGQNVGALYPWRTIGGRECSSYFPAGSAQYHINADVAFALKSYISATGDESILADGGAEMLAETARIWLQIGYHDPERNGAFVINRVTGPDEYSALVDNNLYTNLMAAEHMRFAVASAPNYLSLDEATAMLAAADSMFLPYDEAHCIPAQDASFFAREPWPFTETPSDHYPLLLHYHPLTIYRHRISKQADAVLAMALLPHAFDLATRARMLNAYEAVTVHDSTLSASPFAIAAASVGDTERAFHYWRVTSLTDTADLFGNSNHGLHMAALAGAWNTLARGFAGMRSVDGLSFAPIAVPQLGNFAFSVRYHGCRLQLAIEKNVVRYALEEGTQLQFRHQDEALSLAVGESIERALS